MKTKTMNCNKKYAYSLIAEIALFIIYFIHTKLVLKIIGIEGNQINLLGVLILFSFHSSMNNFRTKLSAENPNLKRINTYVEIFRFIIILTIVYNVQVKLDAGV